MCFKLTKMYRAQVNTKTRTYCRAYVISLEKQDLFYKSVLHFHTQQKLCFHSPMPFKENHKYICKLIGLGF